MSITFLIAALIVIATPGPDMLNSLALGLARGRREGVAYALGVGVGCFVHTAWAVLGISAVVAASAQLFALIKWLGVAYLVHLGIQALRDQGSVRLPGAGETLPSGTLAKRFRDGVLTNALNPKVMLFFLAFLPQFVHEQGSVAGQMLAMGATFALITTVAYCGLAWFAGSIGANLLRTPHFALWLNRATGLLFIGLAVRLAFVGSAAAAPSGSQG